MKIRGRVILVIVLTNFAIILMAIFAAQGYVRENIERYIEEDMTVVADIADRYISSDLEILRHTGSDIVSELAKADSSAWPSVLKQQLSIYPDFIALSIINSKDEVVTSTGLNAADSSCADLQAIKNAFSGQSSFSSTVAVGSTVVFYLAVPLPNNLDNVLVLTLDGMYFSNLASKYQIWQTGHIFIDDNEGYVIANSREEWVLNRQNFINLALDNPQYEQIAQIIEKLISGQSGVDYYVIDGTQRICAFRPITGSTEGWSLGIVAPLSESPVRDVDRGLLLIAVVGFVLNVIAAIIASNFIRKPFEDVAALQIAAETSSRAKSDFLAHMSHEIRTPLNAVVGLSELALDNNCLDDETSDKLSKIHTSGMTILSIVNDILDISKIESGKFEIFPGQYDTPSMINDVLSISNVRIGEKPIKFKLTVDENLPSMLYGDDLRVKQIFNNLLSNAFKYTEAGAVEWALSFERAGDKIWLKSKISDTGIGIKSADLSRLFSDYNQVDTNANRRVEGTGLGLAITKRLVEMMDGDIDVQSVYGEGSVFEVSVCQGIASEVPIGKELAANLMKMQYTVSKRAGTAKIKRDDLSYAAVLIVDDVQTNLDVVKGMLKPYGMRVDCAISGPRAIELIKARKVHYDAIFMDHMMPGMDGIEATRIIREELGGSYAQNIPIIALTANAIVGNDKMFISHGFQDFISKPIDMLKLDAVLRRFVKRKKPNQKQDKCGDMTGEPTYSASSSKMSLDGIDIAGIDKDQALMRFAGDGLVFIDVLRSYVANTAPLLALLRSYVDTKNMPDYAIVVHGIKGSSMGICANALGEKAKELELAAKNNELDQVSAQHAVFEKEVETMIDTLKEILASLDVLNEVKAANVIDKVLLDELVDAAKAFDMDKVDRLMTQIESYDYQRGNELVSWLRKQVNNMDFEAIYNRQWPEY